MTETLFTLTYRVARELAVVTEGVATGGGATSIVDTVERTEADDYWNGGTAWILRDAGGASAAPEGEFSFITDHVQSTKTLTLRSTLTAAVASGDKYALADKRFPQHILIQMVNAALMELGRIPIADTTSITTADDQTEYTLPSAVYPDNLKRVWIQTDNTDSDDNRWTELYNWYPIITATGTADTLVLPFQPPSGYAIKLDYIGLHPELHLYNSQLSEAVPIERVVYTAASLCFRWFKDKYKVDTYDESMARMMARADEMKSVYQIKRPRKPSRIVNFADTGSGKPDSEPDHIYL